MSWVSLQVLPPRGLHPLSKYRTAHLHIRAVEGAHDRLDPVLVHLLEEQLYRLLRRRTRWVGADGCGGATTGTGLYGVMQEEELGVAGRDEAGDVVIEEFVDALKIPLYVSLVFSSPQRCSRFGASAHLRSG